ncbi:MAG: poly(3-hydroxybutyrate) depolymerase [Oleiphilus sp.]|nr:MAG: poly(3-hydroxybutyrate) depolymerase [Oleiphilus sp.]
MSVIQLSRAHDQDLAHAKAYAEEIAQSLSEKFGVKYQWDDLIVSFKGAGAKGYLSIADQHVEVRMELSFMLRPFKGRIEQEINRHLDEFCS